MIFSDPHNVARADAQEMRGEALDPAPEAPCELSPEAQAQVHAPPQAPYNITPVTPEAQVHAPPQAPYGIPPKTPEAQAPVPAPPAPPVKSEPQLLGAGATAAETVDVPVRRDAAGRLFAVTGAYQRALRARGAAPLVVRVPSRIAELCTLSLAGLLYALLLRHEAPTRDVVLRATPAELLEPPPDPGSSREAEEAEVPCVTAGCPRAVHSLHGAVAVGGTFDRLHAGHRLLLTVAAWTARRTVYLGVTVPDLLHRKQHAHLIEPWGARAALAADFVRRTKPVLRVVPSELTSTAGIAGVEPELDALIVSQETLKGGHDVNATRLAGGLRELSLIVVPLLQLDARTGKLSSTALRQREDAADAPPPPPPPQ